MATPIISYLRYALKAVAEVLLPRVCANCEGKLLETESSVCLSCIEAIARTEHPLLSPNGVDILLGELILSHEAKVHYQSGAAWAFYNRERGSILRNVIDKGKFGSHPQPEIFYVLGMQAAREFADSELLEGVQRLVPIPLSSRRFRERGFNQSEWICRGLSQIWRLPIDTTHLKRVVDNPHQSRARISERAQNVKGVFRVDYPEEWKNTHILLVDDVITSGSTLFEAMQCLTPIRGCTASIFALGWAHN